MEFFTDTISNPSYHGHYWLGRLRKPSSSLPNGVKGEICEQDRIYRAVGEVEDESILERQGASRNTRNAISSGREPAYTRAQLLWYAPPLPPPTTSRGNIDPRKTFVCNLCGDRFARVEHVDRRFISIHRNGRRYECDLCGKIFSEINNLVQHQQTHGGEGASTPIVVSND